MTTTTYPLLSQKFVIDLIINGRCIVDDFCCVPLSCKYQECKELYEESVLGLVGWAGKHPTDPLKKALERDPDFFMGNVILGIFDQKHLHKAEAIVSLATSREQKHLKAARYLANSKFRSAAQMYEEILLDHPTDILAVKLAADSYVAVGDAANLRDSPGRVLETWKDHYSSLPVFGSLLGMYAFGLEENNNYLRAEQVGRDAVEAAPLDAWAVHSVLHVMEMESRQCEGISFFKQTENNWKRSIPYRSHNYWHLGLYYIELEKYQDALSVFDKVMSHPQGPLDLIDSSSLLLRLEMENVDVGDRWHESLEHWEPFLEKSVSAFTDVHALMALVGGKEFEKANKLLERMQQEAQAAGKEDTDELLSKSTGHIIGQALLQRSNQQYDNVVDSLWRSRCYFQSLGGSIAQRDIFEIMMIKSALQSDSSFTKANALLSERIHNKPGSPASWKWYADLLTKQNDAEKAHAAISQYRRLIQT